MPGQNDSDLDLEDQDGSDTDDSGDSDDGAAAAAAGDGDGAGSPPKDDKADKRIRDLQSRADSETARANKAEAALKALNEGKGAGNDDPATQALMQELREASLDAVYGEFSELKKFGIDRSLIEGSTRAEMREAATSIVALVKSVATKARNDALSEHGIKPEPAGSTRTPPKSYDALSDEDFRKLLDSM